MPTAYSYIRFSHPSQLEGDSLRRQTEGAAEYCRRNGLTLDTTLTLRDLGVSAFKGKNAAAGNFRTFLDAVKGGQVKPGSVLIVESFDRISRQGIDEGYDLIKSILKAGVDVVTLLPERRFDQSATKSLSKGALEIQLILERAAEESDRKSERVGKAWREKKKNAGEKVLTKMTPGWINCEDDKLVLDKAKAATVKRIFKMAREGLGIGRISQKLNAENVPVLGRTEFRGRGLLWSVNVVYKVLTNRATFGEYQPHVGSRGPDRKPVGEPVKNYYPAVITEDEYNAVRSILSSRASKGRGRRGTHVNLFAGLLKDARTGGSLTAKHYGKRPDGNRQPVLLPVESRTTTGQPWATFGLKQFEDSIRSELAEVKVKDIAPEGDDAQIRVESLTAQLEDLKIAKAKWREKGSNPNLVDEVAAQLNTIEERRKELTAKLVEAEQDAASPIRETWKRARDASKTLEDDNSDDARERYRAEVRRAVESIWVLIMPGSGDRFAAVQVWFKSGAHRDYLIGYTPARGVRLGVLHEPRSLSDVVARHIDLRKEGDVKELEAALAKAIAKEKAKKDKE